MQVAEEDVSNVKLFDSIKALEGYTYFYHLLLGFGQRYPEIFNYAQKKGKFVHDDTITTNTCVHEI